MDAYINFEPNMMFYSDFPTVYFGALDVFTAETPDSPAHNYGYFLAACVPVPPVCNPTLTNVNISNLREIDFS